MALKLIKQSRCFGGVVKQFSHESATTRSTMQFCVFLPPNASETQKVPVVYFLAGLTCNDELMQIKAGAQRIAAARGIAIVTPDTSPRGVDIEGADDAWDFGSAAGFYVDATEPKWSAHYNMYSYVTKELPSIVNANLPILSDKASIMGHSMGGHGALTLALRNPELYKAVSAFAPIAHPTQCPWGIKAFTGYLGTDQATWKNYDATLLVLEKGAVPGLHIWVDQGTDDQWLQEKQLLPEAFEVASRRCDGI
ncbi:S-formylglutathione hydrolase, variant 1 [Aphanomyces astaci]|uniref:S-formylglutathione hydrolase n=1 Tax=Aphanomyces astaci TaxID=112090 RepID=W4GDX3_APHAT|nr:S-formylglutathione hydrolase, variant 1 [Aphanomyces astaci]ETV77471.1 S-formylglutathione hydrolase, variant 1 [Aphanomyces astaci]|eukprot:XP_009833258.1 S-formylglutathione hydrolase, variant 1 [Aphanomyces astaci]